jgi:REP element-mobilizing transposase RayT
MVYDPDIHHRRSIRLKEYDYSQGGVYFLTMCVNKYACLFGKIVDLKMVLNEAGQMIIKWYEKIPSKFNDIDIYDFMVMPDHFHAIIINTELPAKDGHSPLKDIVGWFKTMTTNEYIEGVKEKKWQPFADRLWQRNYYEHIIRSQKGYYFTVGYIQNNPSQWREKTQKNQKE